MNVSKDRVKCEGKGEWGEGSECGGEGARVGSGMEGRCKEGRVEVKAEGE